MSLSSSLSADPHLLRCVPLSQLESKLEVELRSNEVSLSSLLRSSPLAPSLALSVFARPLFCLVSFSPSFFAFHFWICLALRFALVIPCFTLSGTSTLFTLTALLPMLAEAGALTLLALRAAAHDWQMLLPPHSLYRLRCCPC